MTKTQILALCTDGHKFLSPDALEYILSKDDPIEFTNLVLRRVLKDKMFLNKNDVVDAITGDAVLHLSHVGAPMPLRNICDIKVYKDSDVTGESRGEGLMDDFLKYFNNRFNTIKRLIERRVDFQRATDIGMAKSRRNKDREFKIIGMVDEIITTRNNHVIVSIADLTGGVKIFLSNKSPLRNQIFVNDEVVGVIGKFNEDGELFYPSSIVRPSIPRTNKWDKIETTSKVLFMSDLHVGSKAFINSGWDKMIEWVNGNYERECINYIVLPGDVVDGIGIYMSQESDLEETDIYKQYEALAERLKEFPDDLKIVVQPGNHDAVRLAEPQPAIGKVFLDNFDSNVVMTGNPVTLEIEGKVITSYHGKSIDDWIQYVPRLNYDNPIEVMKEMCIRRHLAPIYGAKNQLSPENKDYLVMEYAPDIFVTGHVHKIGSGMFNGVRLINASTFQNQTTFQKQHNFNPSPCMAPLVSLSDGKTTICDFNI